MNTPPSAEQWDEIKRILDEAWEHPPEERAAFLDEACAGDAALRRHVEKLLDAEAEAPPFLDDAAIEHATELLAGLADPDAAPALEDDLPAGRRMGAYRIVEEVGRGGMSTVYRAERADEAFEQQVAVKVLRRRMGADADFARRFRAERQILASFQHPHIARVFDGGVTAEGRPYLVMELIEGEPLITYCEHNGLDLDARLALFEKVAGAVQHAHRKLVVHRDLKPSNILVTDAGTPKLVDFGIAKLLDEATPQTLPVTRTGQFLMTPEYAAPEQLTDDPITTATDVYQLGVVLYELLAGRRPYEFERKTPSVIERVILEQTPEKPSTVAGERQPALQGDLDTIIMKALRKEPERRYASVEALIDDVQRHRDGRPVEARPATWRYRTRKFVRRHRWGALSTAAVVLVIAGVTAFYVMQITQARDRAQAQAAKAEQVSAFLVSLFEASDPNEALGDTITARELLQRGADRVLNFQEQPVVQAQMMSVMGEIYRKLGLYTRAQPLLERALTIQKQRYGPEHPEIARTLQQLADVAFYKRDYDRAEALERKALALYRELFGGDHPTVASSLNELGVVLRRQGHLEEAEALYRQALAIRRENMEDSVAVTTILNNLAVVMAEQGNLEAADSLYRQVLAQRRQLLGPAHTKIANTLHNLGVLMVRKGNLETAAHFHRQALAMERKLLGEKHPLVALSMNELAGVLRRQGNYAAAEPLYRGALAIRQAAFGKSHPAVATSLNNLAGLLRDQGNYAAAESLYRRAVDLYRTLLGAQHPWTAIAMKHLGAVLTTEGEYKAAEPVLINSYNIFRAQRGPDDTYTQQAIERIIQLYEAWGKPAKAAVYRDTLATASGNRGSL